MNEDTIFALASALGRVGIAVFRLSGPRAGAVFERLTGRPVPPPRRVTRAVFRDPETGVDIDDGLALWFAGPASYSGEDVAEFHVHGGHAVVAAMTAALSRQAGCRLAEPGEFTRRAFENGKLDLTEAEAVADLVAAETEAQRLQALRQLRGALGKLYEGWRGRLLNAVAHLEAWIDFPEEDLPDDVAAEVDREIEALVAEIAAHLDDGGRGERLREGLYVAILGAPNVGKSSLLNALARRDAAIVAETAGTTRDVIEVHLDVGGFPTVLADTAGLREARDEIERAGVARALSRAREADLKIVMFDATVEGCADTAAGGLVDGQAIAVLNKVDLARPAEPPTIGGQLLLPLSVATGEGLAAVLDRLQAMIRDRFAVLERPAVTRARHRAALQASLEALRRSGAASGVELQAEDLRLALRSIGRITGRVDVEDLLDVIFRDFCIGK